MKIKPILASILTAACLSSLIVVPSAAASSASGTVSTFSDITDPTLGESVEALRMMGVIDGLPGGTYNPEGNLNRAEFCKLTVTIMGLGDQVAAQANRTVFSDVTGTYWARGYINLASAQVVEQSSGARLIMGIGDGTFRPGRNITFGEAITILLRVLGYTAEASVSWPQGAISTAQTIGLTKGLPFLTSGDAITRGQAALLFYNMLLANPKESGDIYAASRGSVVSGALLLNCNAKTADGSSGAVQVSGKDAVLPAVNNPASFFQGKSGIAVYNSAGRFLTFLPNQGTSNSTVISNGASASGLTLNNGTFLALSASTPVWRNDEKSTYGESWVTLDRRGVSLTVYYTAAGGVDYIYVNTTSSTGGAVINFGNNVGNPFLSLVGKDTGYTIYKNGSQATSSDIRQYDVATYDPTTRSLMVSDLRLSGVYEEATPNLTAPTKIKLLGAEFPVLESAWDTLRNFQVGSAMTLLFTSDGMVAGAVSPSECRANAVGIASISGSTATVKLLDSVLPELKGTYIGSNVGNLDGQLVSVTYSGRGGNLSLVRLTSSSLPGALDVSRKTLGSTPLSNTVHIYDRVGKGPVVEVALADIPFLSVPADDITYARTNYAGKVDLIVLNDITGTAYQYGIVSTSLSEEKDENGNPSSQSYNITFSNPKNSITVTSGVSTDFGSQFVGWVSASSSDGTKQTLVRTIGLIPTTSFSRQNIDLESNSVKAGILTLPLSSDLLCYNSRSGSWVASLNDFLASSNTFVAYYDRNPNEGGKVRILVSR